MDAKPCIAVDDTVRVVHRRSGVFIYLLDVTDAPLFVGAVVARPSVCRPQFAVGARSKLPAPAPGRLPRASVPPPTR